MRCTKISLILAAALSIGASPILAQAEDSETYDDDYRAGDYGRVLFEENGGAIVRAIANDVTDGDDQLTPNAAIFPGDTVRTGSRQRVEIQLSGGTLVRVDRGTDLAFLSLPNPSAQVADNSILKLSSGSLQLAARVKNRDEFRIDSPAASVYLLGDGDFRVEVGSDGTTRVQSRRGVAEVVGEGGSVLVRGGTRTTVVPGAVPDDPRTFHTFASDDFDNWIAGREEGERIRERAAVAGDTEAYEELPVETRPYYRELSSYGRWVAVPTYGYVWYPFDSGPGWRPYLAGRWSYGSRGYFWVSSEPWGWAPYHYGRWTWVGGYGWCWIPGSVFGGAWVSWSWSPSYVGWCPLDYWNRPAFHGTIRHGYYDPDCWTFVGYAHIAHGDYRRYAVPVDRIGSALAGAAVVTRPPRASPRAIALDPSARQRAFREAAEDRRSRLAEVTTGSAAPTRSFSDVERRIVRPRTRTNSPPPSEGGPETGRSGARPAVRTRTVAPSAGIQAPASGTPFPRRITQPPRDVPPGREATAPAQAPLPGGRRAVVRRGLTDSPTAPREESVVEPSPPAGAPARRDPRFAWTKEPPKPRDAEDRVRQMYRRGAGPRIPREQIVEVPAPPGGERVAQPEPGSPAPDRANPRLEPRSAGRVASPRPTEARPPAQPQRQARSGNSTSGVAGSRERKDREGKKK